MYLQNIRKYVYLPDCRTSHDSVRYENVKSYITSKIRTVAIFAIYNKQKRFHIASAINTELKQVILVTVHEQSIFSSNYVAFLSDITDLTNWFNRQ
jgi:hypothetical protein